MAAGRGATGQAQSNLGLGRVGILDRTGLGGAHYEGAGVLHSQAQPPPRAGGFGGIRSQGAWQFGDVHLPDLKGSWPDIGGQGCCRLGLAGRPPGNSVQRGGLLFWLEGGGRSAE